MAKIAFRCAFPCQSSRKLAREATVTMSSAMYAALSLVNIPRSVGRSTPGFFDVFLNLNIWLMMINDGFLTLIMFFLMLIYG